LHDRLRFSVFNNHLLKIIQYSIFYKLLEGDKLLVSASTIREHGYKVSPEFVPVSRRKQVKNSILRSKLKTDNYLNKLTS